LSLGLVKIDNLLFIMLSFVYHCEKSTSKIRFLVSRALDGNLNVQCPEFEKLWRFILFGQRNTGNGLFSKVSIINKRRRDGDGLYVSNKREQEVP
jgi:hypothetical protein